MEHRKVLELTPDPRNARRHPDKQVAQIASSIARFGFNAPVLIDGAGMIVAGHGRVMAAKKLGLETVPVVVLDHLSADEKRAYILADNRIAENAEWEWDKLRQEMAALDAIDIDLPDLGFDEKEIAKLLREPEIKDDAPDDADDGGVDDAPNGDGGHVSREGDVWILGSHRLMCGDSTDTENVIKLRGGGRPRGFDFYRPAIRGKLWGRTESRCAV